MKEVPFQKDDKVSCVWSAIEIVDSYGVAIFLQFMYGDNTRFFMNLVSSSL